MTAARQVEHATHKVYRGPEARKTSLSRPRQQLMVLMQQIGFGEIHGLVVRGGEPQFDPPPEVVREVKLGAGKETRYDAASGNFALRDQVVDLFKQIELLGTGTIESLEIKGGLPFRLRLRGKVTAATSRHAGDGRPNR
jgi:hypothetical protein